ncbi:MAG: hypothetical protein H8K07_01715 [Nitrospira sp.]|nr:hypothetical protein [Nitrospira sp.]
MTILMTQTIHESLTGGRTTQEFVKGARYDVPQPIGQLWIARGWARPVHGLSGLSGLSGARSPETTQTGQTRQTRQTRQTSSTKEPPCLPHTAD